MFKPDTIAITECGYYILRRRLGDREPFLALASVNDVHVRLTWIPGPGPSWPTGLTGTLMPEGGFEFAGPFRSQTEALNASEGVRSRVRQNFDVER